MSPVPLVSLPLATRRLVEARMAAAGVRVPAKRETKKTNKYGAKKTVVDGKTFASKAEARRYLTLRDMLRAGLIGDLVLQPAFILAPSVRFEGKRAKPALRYIADFSYVNAAGVTVVEDVKGVETDTFRAKRHLMLSVHGIEIKLVK